MNASFPPVPRWDTLTSLLQGLNSERATLAGMRVYLPGSRSIRLSVVLGNLRMQRMLDALLRPGQTVVDVGANIGYNTLYAAKVVGPSGRVIAIEPAQDNLTYLYANIFANQLRQVSILPYAAGSRREIKQFFLRGEASAVNSLYEDNFYHPITASVEVLTVPLDDLIAGTPDLVKIDVEGGELEVLQGMHRLLMSPTLRLIVEWHPTLQQAAGYAADALPRRLLDLGFTVTLVSHTGSAPLVASTIPAHTAHLLHSRSPVELLAMRPA
jgi:FkbM family methyltransferase